MTIKIHTLIKGAIWELLGVLILSGYMLYTTGSWQATLSIGFGYPAFRAVTWYPYERLFKWIRRRKYTNQTKETPHVL